MITEISIVLIGIALLLSYRGLFALADKLLQRMVEVLASTMVVHNIIKVFL